MRDHSLIFVIFCVFYIFCNDYKNLSGKGFLFVLFIYIYFRGQVVMTLHGLVVTATNWIEGRPIEEGLARFENLCKREKEEAAFVKIPEHHN